MEKRSKVYIALVFAMLGVVVVSGFGVLVFADFEISFEADSVGVDKATLAETEYQLVEDQNKTIERSVRVFGQEQTVIVTNKIKTYEKEVLVVREQGTVNSVGSFTVLSTPNREFFGKSVNPIATLPNDKLIQMVGDQPGTRDLKRIGKQSEYEIMVNGEETTVSKYKGTTIRDGYEFDVLLHLARTKIDGDTVVGVEIYPALSEQRTSDEIDMLMTGLEEQSQ